MTLTVIIYKNGIEQEGYCLISCNLCNVKNGKWGNVFNNILKSGKKALSNESKLFCGVDPNNPIDIIFNGQNITENTAKQDIALMKVIWLQQLEEGIKETYESVGKFAVAKKMLKVPYVGFLGIIGMVTSSVEIVNGIESIFKFSSLINNPLSIFNSNYLQIKENPMSKKSRSERRGNANRKEKNWQKKATQKELKKSENNKIKKGFLKDLNNEHTSLKAKDEKLREMLYEELGETIEEKYEQSVKYLNNDISIIEIVK